MKRSNLVWSFAAGLLLSAVELTRPFVLMLLPLALVGAWQVFRRTNQSRRLLAAFILPLVLLSGGWHLKLMVFNGGQIIWSNHSGFNLARAWPVLSAPSDYRTAPALGEGRWPNLNTQAHYEASQAIQVAFIQDVFLEHPLMAATHAAHRLVDIMEVHTDMYGTSPQSWILPIYRIATWYTLAMLGLNTALLIVAARVRPSFCLFAPHAVLVLFTLGGLLLTAIGESGEEARLLLGFLPCLVAMAWYRLPYRGSHGTS